ncbi:hypothetical protein BCR32DRAFT_273335 [Anaeromyces robustus]|uniref:G-protein coupled receptors family 3 profile domain-containing protein n=1 Tax=Anaeromyces robustus TaxID=1754192 RepID=A0A1Y1VSN7_9FUNG|nr:hypothetical protein BCR32DRAFT_273335 [Anaeromyces robustus]|eukprot:ORX63774.1 hypothetical protein BCR32DRAFT_273335 [Anaeromyces robustus]
MKRKSLIIGRIMTKRIIHLKFVHLLDDRPTKFSMDIYGEDDTYITRYHLNFNYTTNFFNEYDMIKYSSGIKVSIICSDDDIDNENIEKNTILFWNIGSTASFASSSPYIHAFPIWYLNQKKKGKIFCLRIDVVGWFDNANAEICVEDKPCPDLINLETTQLMQRYYNDETAEYKDYIRNYSLKSGQSFESLLNKYSYYDYYSENHWLAIPLQADFRILRFNITTFDYCINKGYDLHYPPWTWEKAFEYAKIIKECTGKPGLRLYNKHGEDTKFLITLCQSLQIPVFIEDTNLNIKKCGLNSSDDYIRSLSIIKELTQNGYIDTWLNETQIEQWKNKTYPKSIDEQPIFSFDENKVLDNKSVNGMIYDVVFSFYVPGESTCIIITKKSKFKDELFEFIEVLIDEKYPFFSELNISVTPFESVHGSRCKSTEKKTKKEMCNSLISAYKTSPFYYMYDKEINIVYFDYINNEDGEGIKINNKSLDSVFNEELQNVIFKCDNEANYKDKTITYSERSKAPISLFFAHLFYKHNDTNEGSFKDITNECCDIINDILIPQCKNTKNIKFTLGECDSKSNKMPINYLNCKNINDEKFPDTTECSYIPYRNFKGMLIMFFSILSSSIELILLVFVIIYRKKECMQILGIRFLIFLILSSITLNISAYLWIGKYSNIKLKYIENVGNAEIEECSLGKEYLLKVIFLFDYVLLALSIITSYQGRINYYYYYFIDNNKNIWQIEIKLITTSKLNDYSSDKISDYQIDLCVKAIDIKKIEKLNNSINYKKNVNKKDIVNRYT